MNSPWRFKCEKRTKALTHEPIINITKPVILLRLSQKYKEGLSPEALYKITRGEWVIGDRRKKAKYAIAVYRGVVLEVYRIEKWMPFIGQSPSNRQRWCFDGTVTENLGHYRGGSVRHYFKRWPESGEVY